MGVGRPTPPPADTDDPGGKINPQKVMDKDFDKFAVQTISIPRRDVFQPLLGDQFGIFRCDVFVPFCPFLVIPIFVSWASVPTDFV